MKNFNLDLVSSTRARTLSLVEDLTREELDYRVDEQGWSPGEILDHLIKSDETYRGQIQQLIDLARSGRRPSISVSLARMGYSVPFFPRALLPLADVPMGVLNLFVPYAFREALLRNRVFAVSAPEALQPQRGRSGEELRQGLSESLEEIRALFRENPDVDFSSFRYYHPLFGYNRVEDIFSLLASHELRHQEQLRLLLRRIPPGLTGQAA